MRYEKTSELPDMVRDYLTEDLQEIYMKAYNEVYENYTEDRGGEAGREAVAHRQGMEAVERDYTYIEEEGKWYPKGEEPTGEEEEADKGIIDQVKDLL
jgi:cation transport regulator ChaB